MEQTDTKPTADVSSGTPDQWPPVAHVWRKTGKPIKESDVALCGAKLMGIPLPNATKICAKCAELLKNHVHGRAQ